MHLPSLITFGSQIAVPDPKYLSTVRSFLVQVEHAEIFTQSLQDLPNLWEIFSQLFPGAHRLPGQAILSRLQQWVQHNDSIDFSQNDPNTILAPLTVITQVYEYLQYLEAKKLDHGAVAAAVQPGGYQGLCIGFLSAVCTSNSRDTKELMESFGVALRIAVFLGAVVDLNGAFSDAPKHPTCIIASSTGRLNRHDLDTLLKPWPEAFVSIMLDEFTVTITARSSDMPDITLELSANGFVMMDHHVQGTYHTAEYSAAVEILHRFCESQPQLQFSSTLYSCLRSSIHGDSITPDCLHSQAVREILLEPLSWNLTMSKTLPQVKEAKGFVLSVGLVKALTEKISRQYGVKVVQARSDGYVRSAAQLPADLVSSFETKPPRKNTLSIQPYCYPEHSIAVIGMGCKFAGADSVDEFWELLKSGISMAERVPEHRLSKQDLDPDQSEASDYWGNFMENADHFDRKFFAKSSREAAAMDPQQRLLLEVTYHAIESAGWLATPAFPILKDVGCFIGCSASEYNDNISCHQPNAFSILGALRGLLSGRVSHHFGWEGPSITYDTACASSMTAIHEACKSLQLKECSAAVAGGVNVITSPNYYRYLDAAGFLTRTGGSRAFDASADGYCRGEGIGVVVLKRYEDAVAHGDSIVGVIAASAMNQNHNENAINIPALESQVKLFQKVLSQAKINPNHISFIEAHGTGTQVGDTIEAESIRQVFGSSIRDTPLYLGSVKDNIGHTEGSAGIAGLIKCLLMMRHGMVSPQANFQRLNPKIAPLSNDSIGIAREAVQWETGLRAACVNSYGAGGCNAALIACQPPPRRTQSHARIGCHPIYISAKTPTSLKRYCQTLLKFVEKRRVSQCPDQLLGDIACALSYTQNRSYSNTLATTVGSIDDLCQSLLAYIIQDPLTNVPIFNVLPPSSATPLVLVFGGQSGRSAYLSKNVFDSYALLRSHIIECDQILQKIGYGSLFPGIFSSQDRDIVSLHAVLFSIQYATARAWIDSGLQISCLIGHSFGQLTALCISQALSLEDGLKLIVGRADLMQRNWGPERGSMLAIEIAPEDFTSFLQQVNASCHGDTAEVACYNGIRNFVLAGSTSTIQVAEEIAKHNEYFRDHCKAKILDMAYAFHSRLSESTLPFLATLAESVTFHKPLIPIELCLERSTDTVNIDPKMIVDHTRCPVYFGNAVHRIAQRLGPCTWLEAGANSPVITMIRRALDEGVRSKHTFHAVNLYKASHNLPDLTTSLWRAGHRCSFWGYHNSQKQMYRAVDIPPYQFDHSSHWLPYHLPSSPANSKDEQFNPLEFCTFKGYSDSTGKTAEFIVSPMSPHFKLLVEGHAVLGVPVCPVSVYLDAVIKATSYLINQQKATPSPSFVPTVEDLEICSSLGVDADRVILLIVSKTDNVPHRWSFIVSSSRGLETPTCHSTGIISLLPDNHHLNPDFAMFEQSIEKRMCQQIEDDPQSQKIQGPVIYTVFGSIVKYDNCFKGVTSISSRGQEVTATVCLPDQDYQERAPLALDTFLQIAGIKLNFLQGDLQDNVFVATRMGKIMFRDSNCMSKLGACSSTWSVYCRTRMIGHRDALNDIFVYDDSSEELVLVILDMCFSRVPMKTLSKSLSRSNRVEAPVDQRPRVDSLTPMSRTGFEQGILDSITVSTNNPPQDQTNTSKILALRRLLSEILDIPLEELSDTTTFDDMGIDSLMVTEVTSSIRQKFGVRLSTTDFLQIQDIRSLSIRLFPEATPTTRTSESHVPLNVSRADEQSRPLLSMGPCYQSLQNMKGKFSEYAQRTTWSSYWSAIHNRHLELVASYIIEAFSTLGCSLDVRPGKDIVAVHVPEQHKRLLSRLFEILEELGFVQTGRGTCTRTTLALPTTSSNTLHRGILQDFPNYSDELKLLNITGSRLSECLSGATQGVNLLFDTKANRDLLRDYYRNSPMLKAATYMLADYLVQVLKVASNGETIDILEVGAGTGGTTAHLMQTLTRSGVNFTYTFTDLSASLVAKARRSFQSYANMRFEVLDIEDPPAKFQGKFHVVISTNCIHATPDLRQACQNIKKMVQNNGLVALVEATHKLPWFDLVFGLLDGWWSYSDERSHALASVDTWSNVLHDVGFSRIENSQGTSCETDGISIIYGLNTQTLQPQRPPTICHHAKSVLIQGIPDFSSLNIFAFPGGFGTAATYVTLPQIHPDIAVYGLNSPFLSDPDAFKVGLSQLAALYILEIRNKQKQGPYTLMGYSVGGVIAYEAARQLIEQGQEVQHLILLDTACPATIPPFPLDLLDRLDGIDRFKGTNGKGGDKTVREKGSANSNKKMQHPHVLATLECLHQYSPVRIRKGLEPRTTLVTARHGVDQEKILSRSFSTQEEDVVVSWLLDNRDDSQVERDFGWNKLIDSDSIEVIPTDGNHFSLMTEPYVQNIASELRTRFASVP